MKRFFWVGLVSVLVAVFGVGNFSYAEKFTEKLCKDYGGIWTGAGACNIRDANDSPFLYYDTKELPKNIKPITPIEPPKNNGSKPKEKTEKEKQEEARKACEAQGRRFSVTRNERGTVEYICTTDKITDTNKDQYSVENSISRMKNNYKGSENPPTDEQFEEAGKKCKDEEFTDQIDTCMSELLAAAIDKNKEEAEKKDQSSCEVQWVGFLVCPGARIGTAFVVNVYNLIAKNLLEIKSEDLFSSSDVALNHWKLFRNIANVGLAIIVSIVVFSQVANVGISNYGIKKMIPRIIIYAVIINLSYWIVAAAVDLSNILGEWIFKSFGASNEWLASAKEGGLGDLVDKILSGAAEIAGLGAMVGVLAITVGGGSILVLLGFVGLALLLMFVILTSRQAVVVMLLIISPIAIAASILPNTEGFYKKWKALLKTMLMIYPICSMMLGGLILASNVLYKTTDNPLFKVVYGLLPMMGLFATAAVIKGVAAMLDKLTGTKTFSAALGKAEGGRDYIKNSKLAGAERRMWGDRGRKYWTNLKNKNPKSKIGRFAQSRMLGAKSAFDRAKNYANTTESANNYDAKRLQDSRMLAYLDSQYELKGDEMDPGLLRRRAELRASFSKEEAQAAADKAESYQYEVAPTGTRDVAAGYQNNVGSINSGESFEVFVNAVFADKRLGGKDRDKLLADAFSQMQGDSAKAGAENIARVVSNHISKVEDANPELAASMRKLNNTARTGSGTSSLAQQEREGVYAKFSAEKISRLSPGGAKNMEDFYNTTTNIAVKGNVLAARMTLSKDLEAKMNNDVRNHINGIR